MLPELAITPPLIGPFVERTTLSGETETGTHLGVALWWTSPIGSMRGDVVRRRESNYWHERLGFAQWPEFDFEEVFDALFSDPTPRLFGFLDEFGEFIQISKHATLHSRADEWLNPALVSHGFSLGHARAHARGVTIPLVWVFRKKVRTRWLGMPYIGVDYVEWSERGAQLRDGSYAGCGGFASNTLFRFASRFASNDAFRWLTQEGDDRMSQLFEAARAKRAAKERSQAPRPSAGERATLQLLRRGLNVARLPAAANADTIASLSEQGYVRLLRSGIAAGSDQSCAHLLSLRSAPERVQEELLDRLIEAGLFKSAEILLPRLPKPRGFNADWTHLLCRAVDSGCIAAVEWALNISPPDNPRVLQYALERAVRNNPAALDLLLNAPKCQELAPAAMLLAFSSSVVFQQWDEASRWLDRGLRPFSVKTSDEVKLDELLRPGGLPLLRRVFGQESVTDDNLKRLLGGCVYGGAETEFLLELSRTTPAHDARMSRLLYSTVKGFLHWGREHTIPVVLRALREGGSLRAHINDFAGDRDLLRGHGWRERQQHLITLIGEMQRAGFLDDARIVASLRRSKRETKLPSRVQSSG